MTARTRGFPRGAVRKMAAELGVPLSMTRSLNAQHVAATTAAWVLCQYYHRAWCWHRGFIGMISTHKFFTLPEPLR